jgi:hypothetical protein
MARILFNAGKAAAKTTVIKYLFLLTFVLFKFGAERWSVLYKVLPNLFHSLRLL